MVHQFDNIELEKHYIFFEYLRKKFPVDGNERIDVSDLVDLDSLNLDIKGKEKMKKSLIYFQKSSMR